MTTEFEPCPKCGSTDNPKSKWDEYDECLTCPICGYSTGFQYIPRAIEVWNMSERNDAFTQYAVRLSVKNI
jgi:transcription elongation factor Elf1